MKKKTTTILSVCIVFLLIFLSAAGILFYIRRTRTREAFLQLSEVNEADRKSVV